MLNSSEKEVILSAEWILCGLKVPFFFSLQILYLSIFYNSLFLSLKCVCVCVSAFYLFYFFSRPLTKQPNLVVDMCKLFFLCNKNIYFFTENQYS